MIKTFHWTEEVEWLAMRRRYLTSTDMPILFGMKPYANSPSVEDLWWEKKTGEARAFKGNEATDSGKAYELAVMNLAAKRQGWRFADLRQTFFYDEDRRIATSVDFGIQTLVSKALADVKCVSEYQLATQWPGAGKTRVTPAMIKSGLALVYVEKLLGKKGL